MKCLLGSCSWRGCSELLWHRFSCFDMRYLLKSWRKSFGFRRINYFLCPLNLLVTLRGVLETKLLLMSSVRESKHMEGVQMHWFVVLGAAGAVEEPGAQSALQMCGNRIYFCTGVWAKCSASTACARCAGQGMRCPPPLKEALWHQTPVCCAFSLVCNKDFNLKD